MSFAFLATTTKDERFRTKQVFSNLKNDFPYTLATITKKFMYFQLNVRICDHKYKNQFKTYKAPRKVNGGHVNISIYYITHRRIATNMMD